jgi:hypothetical protein
VDVGFGHVPLVALARGMLGRDGVFVESDASIESAKV